MVLKYNLKPHITWRQCQMPGQNIKCGKYLCEDFCLSLIVLQLIFNT